MSEIGTFKDVLSDPLISNPDNQAPGHKKRTEPILPEALITVKLNNIRKKKVKGQALTMKCLSLEEN